MDLSLSIFAADIKRKGLPMFVFSTIFWVPVILALSAADLLVENFNPKELSDMGVEIKS